MFDSDRERLGLSGAPKRWPAIPTYDPDRQPSHSAMFIKDHIWVLQVKGLGVVILRAAGVSTFTKDEIGGCPDL